MVIKLCFFIVYLTCSLLTFKVSANVSKTDTTIGFTLTSHSTTLNEQRHVKIYLPESYNHSEQEYPVLYVLDGQWHFTNAVAIQQSLKAPLATPEMIVVGIMNKNPDRRTWFSRESDKFEQYLLKELIPYVDNQYRTQSRKVLFGWEMGAFFSSSTFLQHPDLFEAVILSSGGEIEDDVLNSFASEIKKDKYIYIANSNRDVYTIKFADALSKALSQNNQKKLHWQYDKFDDETHQSTPYLALYQGIKYIFHNYSTPTFIDIREFKQLGGMKYLTTYFNERSKRFGFENAIHDDTKNHLIWLSWKQDNYPEFDEFMTEFSDVLTTKRYHSVFWQNNFGLFYLKHDNPTKAEYFFKSGIGKFPESAKLHNGLGKVYQETGFLNKAKKHYSAAVKFATDKGDNNLAQYQSDLASINL
ncbi:alpha/beta hydrolase-fold protein [Colwelliaceae bacterium 6441]